MLKQFSQLAALSSLVLTVGCGAPRDAGERRADAEQSRLAAVEAVQVLYGSLPLEERLAGSVRARNQTEIYPEVAAPVVEVLVNDGDRVEAGDVLARLRDTELEERSRQAESGLRVAEARVRQAEAQLDRLRAAYERVRTLTERGLGSATELETAQADALSAEADLDLMVAQREQAASVVSERSSELGHATVRAPISGIVGGRAVEVGQRVDSGTRLFVIGDTSEMRVRVTLTERMLGYIRVGTSVNIFTEAAPDDVIRARIDRISPFLHPVAHTTEAEIEVSGHESLLMPGMFVTVDVLYGESELAALVPNAAIYRHPRDGREGVYVTSVSDEDIRGRDPSEFAVEDVEGVLGLTASEVGPRPVRFVPVEIVARGRLASGVAGVAPGQWVVTLGHHLLASRDDSEALVQPTAWEHIIGLQQMQGRDLLNIIAEKLADGVSVERTGAVY